MGWGGEKTSSVYVCIYFTPRLKQNSSGLPKKKKKNGMYAIRPMKIQTENINFEEVDSNMLTRRVNENKDDSSHYTDGGLLLWFGCQVCQLRGVNLQVHCVGGPSEFLPSVREEPDKEMKLTRNPETGQAGSQLLLRILELLLAVL